MIKANELRIGNWIADYECEPYHFKVEEIRKHVGFENWIYYRNGSCKAKEVEPIQLTEDILMKFPRWFRDLIDDGYFNLNELPNGYVDVKYLHTAQNLYFALTGEELNIIL